MSSVSVATRAGKKVSLDDGVVEAFRAGLRVFNMNQNVAPAAA